MPIRNAEYESPNHDDSTITNILYLINIISNLQFTKITMDKILLSLITYSNTYTYDVGKDSIKVLDGCGCIMCVV